ncbi:hypothetical protein PR048_021985 [Dryococelus australis]|uniref:Uncharacterized protein n=1 Tax=Dryococelus australis TaxID=614101 RepID=A0ABQ9GZR1_9NEOP|nr:hypothetical protein PR048_021985 [Dryococelus australis]
MQHTEVNCAQITNRPGYPQPLEVQVTMMRPVSEPVIYEGVNGNPFEKARCDRAKVNSRDRSERGKLYAHSRKGDIGQPYTHAYAPKQLLISDRDFKPSISAVRNELHLDLLSSSEVEWCNSFLCRSQIRSRIEFRTTMVQPGISNSRPLLRTSKRDRNNSMQKLSPKWLKRYQPEWRILRTRYYSELDEVDRSRWLRTTNLRVQTLNCFSAYTSIVRKHPVVGTLVRGRTLANANGVSSELTDTILTFSDPSQTFLPLAATRLISFLFGSQDLDVNSRPNLFTHSLTHSSIVRNSVTHSLINSNSNSIQLPVRRHAAISIVFPVGTLSVTDTRPPPSHNRLCPLRSFAPGGSRSAAQASDTTFRTGSSPPTKVNLVQSPVWPPDFRKWESCRAMPLVGGFPRGSPISTAPSLRRCSIFTSIILIGSKDLAVKSRPNLFTHVGRGGRLAKGDRGKGKGAVVERSQNTVGSRRKPRVELLNYFQPASKPAAFQNRSLETDQVAKSRKGDRNMACSKEYPSFHL